MTKTVRNAASEFIETHIEDQLKINEKKIEELRAENANLIRNARKNAISTVVNLIIKFELPVDEIQNRIADKVIKTMKGETKQRKKAAPKYRNPLDESQTWGGMGNPPKWVKALKVQGTLESTLIPVM